MDNKIFIVCPNCSSRLSIRELPGIQDKFLTCPKCKYKAKVSVYKAQAMQTPAGQPVNLGGTNGGYSQSMASNEPSTVVAGMNGGMQQNIAPVMQPGQLRIMQTGQVCVLHEGSQVIGRLATTSTAEIKIGGNGYMDQYMSRNHARIDVIRRPDGSLEHRLQEATRTVNGIVHNGIKMSSGDVNILEYGDEIVLGKTHFVFEASNNDATRVLSL